MSTVAILKKGPSYMQEDEADIEQILNRLEKLSRRPENPGLAYRNLETINALVATLRKKVAGNDIQAGE